jgi:hypothetical protein
LGDIRKKGNHLFVPWVLRPIHNLLSFTFNNRFLNIYFIYKNEGFWLYLAGRIRKNISIILSQKQELFSVFSFVKSDCLSLHGIPCTPSSPVLYRCHIFFLFLVKQIRH